MSIERYQHLKTTLEKIPLLAEKLEEQKEQLRKKIQAHRDELKGVEKKFQTLMTKEEQLFYDEEKKISRTIHRCEIQINESKEAISEREKSVHKILEKYPRLGAVWIHELKASLAKLEKEKFHGNSAEIYLNRMEEKRTRDRRLENNIEKQAKPLSTRSEIYIDTESPVLWSILITLCTILSFYRAYGEVAFLYWCCINFVGFLTIFWVIIGFINEQSKNFKERKNVKNEAQITRQNLDDAMEKNSIRKEVASELKSEIEHWNDLTEQIDFAEFKLKELRSHEPEIARRRKMLDDLTQELNDSKINLRNYSEDLWLKRKQEMASGHEFRKSEVRSRHEKEIEKHRKSISISESRIEDMWASIKDLIPYSEIVDDL